MNHTQKVKEFIYKFYPEWNIDKHLLKGDSVEICENGDVIYNSIVIIKTQIKSMTPNENNIISLFNNNNTKIYKDMTTNLQSISDLITP